MKFVIGLALVGAAEASFSAPYLRSMASEATIRAFELAASGDFNCQPGFTGADCSQLKCAYSPSFTTSDAAEGDWLYTPSNAMPSTTEAWDTTLNTAVITQDSTFSNQHTYKECGGRGTCDRATGECKCFGSFTGEGCRRTSCPNSCSGHGVCINDNTAFFRSGTDANTNPWGDVIPDDEQVAGADSIDSAWQRTKFQQCVCDRGYEGYDCSLRRCPKGDDPETSCDNELASDIQQFTCTQTAAVAAFFALSFTDQMGGTSHTRPILFDPSLSDDENAESVQDALEALPNFAIPSVEVDFDGTDFDVTFVDASTTGQQHLLSFTNNNDCESGQQPKLGTDNDITCSVARDVITVDEYREQAECSNRGSCDRDTGICTCYSGYFGLACDQVTTYI